MGATTKQRVLDLLNASRGEYISGQQLAQGLGVSRTAVWKAIAALRGDGYAIDATTNLGYCLSRREDVISAQAILSQISPTVGADIQLEYRPTVVSTNQVLKEQAAAGAAEGCVLVSGEQTAGRGRRGRAFYSPADTGVYVSILLRPDLALENTAPLTALAAVAAAKAVEAVQQAAGVRAGQAQIKWVNDIVQGGKKLCGILTEAATDMESGGVDYVVVGTGLNVCQPTGGWPKELQQIAGSILPKDKYFAGARALAAAAYIQCFWQLYRPYDSQQVLREYRSRQLVLGQNIQLLRPGHPPVDATAVKIADNCGLVVQYPDGSRQLIRAGEVSIKRGDKT